MGPIIGQIEKPLICGAIRITTNFGHGNRAPDIGVSRFVCHWGIRGNRGRRTASLTAGCSWLGKTASLNDESWHRAVENRILIPAGIGIGQKVGCR